MLGGPMTGFQKLEGQVLRQSDLESQLDRELLDLLKKSSILDLNQWCHQLNVFLKRQSLSRLLFLDLLYRQIVEVPGVICEFGVQYGTTLVTLMNLRGIYEPYNSSRTIFGFDTFAGFPRVHKKDGPLANAGDFAVPPGYDEILGKILSIHECNAPLAHIKKWGLLKGDVSSSLPAWLDQNQHAIISMAIFDMDVYEPTLEAINLLKPRFTRGTLLVFDELNAPHFPGETLALMEAIGLNKLMLKRHPHQSYCSWARFGD
jgi:Macrocin-O-methyltransferase (TylF)